MQFQRKIEQECFGGRRRHLKAPAQRMADFSNGKHLLPARLLVPAGLTSVNLEELLPGFIYRSLARDGRVRQKMKGYFTNDAVVVATESRTSSPFCIPRDNESGASAVE